MSSNRVVAVVDDGRAVLDSLKFFLELDGYAVATYDSARAFLDDRAADPACVIADQHIPHITGLELAAWLRAEGKNMPVLLITGATSPTIVAGASQFGIEVLEKPMRDSDLLRFVNAHCSKQAGFSGNYA